MRPDWNILRSMAHCHYKAWLLSKEPLDKIYPEITTRVEIVLPLLKLDAKDKLAVLSTCLASETLVGNVTISYGPSLQTLNLRPTNQARQAHKLLADTLSVIDKTDPPIFYKNAHCPECQFQSECLKKLKEKDCISLLGGISPKILAKYHKKGIFSVTQLSYLFRPRRRSSRKPQTKGSFPWELKALAIREQKTFVMHPPDLEKSSALIFMDFEGLPDEGYVYLLGGLVKQEGKPDETFSYWAESKDGENEIFTRLFALLDCYPSATICHYGSYESKTMKQAAMKWPKLFNQKLPRVEERMVNLLSYLRTHVYPPIYSNGLKELAAYLGFKWKDEEASGLLSLTWRKNWETSREEIWKAKLLQYNSDDCTALETVYEWLLRLTTDIDAEDLRQVAKMKRQSPYKFQSNPEFGEDYQYVNKAAYFDYQRKKVYWRNQKGISPATSIKDETELYHLGKGHVAWQPKKVNQTVIAYPLKECPKCGHTKLYQCGKRTGYRQTDLKFTNSGVKQWVTEYQSSRCKCAKCRANSSNGILKRMHYGDNLFAWAMNLYINYNLSHYMISRMLLEQFGIWMNPLYLVMRKQKWCCKWEPEADYLWQIIKNSPIIHIDETTIKLTKGDGYVWVFATPHTVFYHFTVRHEAEFLLEWLKGYKGVIITDFLSAYDSLGLKRQKCLVHLIRDLNDDLFKNPFDEEFKAIVNAFGGLLRKIIETVDCYGLKKRHLQKHFRDTERFCQNFLENNYKSELASKYCKRLKKHWEQLWTFLHSDDVPWNNNNAEAAIKAFAVYRRGVKGQVSERGVCEHLKMLGISQTCRYRNVSFLDFLRGKAGIWENVSAELLPYPLPFNQARLYIQRLGFERKQQWTIWKNEKKRPAFIPSSPERTYREKGWVDWHDWIGFSFMPFEQARTYMRRLGLKNREEYWAWQQSGRRPKSIPASPEEVYEHTGWKDLGDWLGTGNTGKQKKKRMSYEHAKAYLKAIGIKSQTEFFEWRKSGERPETIPPDPVKAYCSEFESWGKFLGTERVANQDKEYWDYERAKDFLKPLYIRSLQHFLQLYELGIIPKQIPKKPSVYFKKQGTWVSLSDFYGKG